MKSGSRWPTRLLCIGLALWYARFGLARRHRAAAPTRILIAHNLLLGDTIMLAPLMKKLRTQFPQAEILMTCKPAMVPLFGSRPYGVRAVAFDPRAAGSFLALFKQRGFDLAYLPADNRLSWLARALNSRWVVAFEGDRPAYKNWPVDEFRPFPDHLVAIGDIFAGCLVDGPPPAPYDVSDWVAPPAQPFPLPPAPYGVFHVGAGSPLRYWEPEKWRALIEEAQLAGMTPVLTAGRGEEALIGRIDAEGRHRSFAGTLSLPQMWRLLSGARMVVCPDTGVGHLARLAGAPTVVLFGPGSATLVGGGEFWRNVPERKVTIANFPCRDENLVFRRHLSWAGHCGRNPVQCGRRVRDDRVQEENSPAKCMIALTAGMVTEAMESLLAETGR